MLRKLMLGVITIMLGIGAGAAPVAAVDPADVVWINGLPTKVDVCIGKTELISHLRFGRAVGWIDVPARGYRFVIRKAASGKCNGTKLGVVKTTFAEGADHTAVIWKPYSKLKIRNFKNDTSAQAGMASISYRHTAKRPAAVDVWLWEHVTPSADGFPPTFNDLKRGTASKNRDIRPGQFSIDTFPSQRTRYFSWEGHWGRADAGRFIEVYLIGTTKKNTKVVSISQVADVAPQP